ncbi:MAG: GvpL/GvpF family gas vesicle protein [Polyangiaceae bacterium]|nr:GvpL/GvpF family gas vesicle protein [Polyangiaceae bacterium]
MSHRYVYAIGARGTRLPSTLRGWSGAPIGNVEAGELVAFATAVDASHRRPTSENLVSHELTVEDIRRFVPALPARFGTVLPTAEGVRRALLARHDLLLDALRRVGDKLEMGIVIVGPDAHHPVARGIYERLRAYVLEVSRACPAAAPVLLRGAFLLASGDVVRLRRAFTRITHAEDRVRCLLSGPWPPYSFIVTEPEPTDVSAQYPSRYTPTATPTSRTGRWRPDARPSEGPPVRRSLRR